MNAVWERCFPATSNTFLRIAITMPDEVEEEGKKIETLLNSGKYDYVHIRKPEWSEERLKALIETIDPQYYSRLKLHSHFSLVAEYGLGGCHLNRRWPVVTERGGKISRSFHSIEEINNWIAEEKEHADCYEYVSLSPIFDSISKPGYLSRFDINKIKNIRDGLNQETEKDVPPILALGGVTPDRYPLLQAKGFAGAMLLGHAWNHLK